MMNKQCVKSELCHIKIINSQPFQKKIVKRRHFVLLNRSQIIIPYIHYIILLIHFIFIIGVLTPLSAIFQLYHGNQYQWCKKPEYPERTTDHGQTAGKLYHLRLRVECTFFCNLQSQARTHAVLVIGLYELLGNPTT